MHDRVNTHPFWYGEKPIPIDPALHHHRWFHSLPESERNRLLNEDLQAREAAEEARLQAGRKEEAARLKREAKGKT